MYLMKYELGIRSGGTKVTPNGNIFLPYTVIQQLFII